MYSKMAKKNKKYIYIYINWDKKYRVKAVSFVKENIEIIQHSSPARNQQSKFPMA